MTTRRPEDPIRWRDLSTSDLKNRPDLPKTIELEIGEAARLLGTKLPSDDLRLAQIRRRLIPLLGQSGAGAPRVLRPSIQIALLLIASMGLGGVATAVTGRFLGWRRATGTTLTPGLTATLTTTQGRENRRWRVAVDARARLDLIVGPEGTALAVLEGRAEITPEDRGDGAVVPPGAAWRGAGSEFVSPHEPSLPESQPLLPKAWPADPLPATPGSSPAPAPARRKKEASDGAARMPAPVAHLDRTIAVSALAPPESEGPPNQRESRDSVVPPNATVDEGAAVTPPRFEPPVGPGVPASAPGGPTAAGRPGSPSPTSVSAPSRRGLPSPPQQSGLDSASDAAMLMLAFRRLRTEHDALGALALIDEHDRRFGGRGLAREATLARAEALLALGQKGAALGVLEDLNLTGSSIDRRAALARAELRAAKDRPADAIHDFDVVLQGGLDDELGARALYGRAVVRGATGDAAGARVDLRDYLKRFSDGARRSDAMAMLRRLGG